MLQWILTQNQPFIATDNLGDNNSNSWKSEDHQEVKICDAFTHLVIAEHGTVAIATNRYSTVHAEEDPPNLVS